MDILRCWCCNSYYDLHTGKCPICDMGGLMSPPHVCAKNGIIITDEHECQPEFNTLEHDYEIEIRKRNT